MTDIDRRTRRVATGAGVIMVGSLIAFGVSLGVLVHDGPNDDPSPPSSSASENTSQSSSLPPADSSDTVDTSEVSEPTESPELTSDPPPEQPEPEPEAQPEPEPEPEPESTPEPQTASTCNWDDEFQRATTPRPGANWIISDRGAWGMAEIPGNTVWIAPRTPCDKVYDVAVHEWVHVMQSHVYGDAQLAENDLARFGGLEAVADCGALVQGADWVHYGCPSPAARDAARAILDGQQP